MCGMVVSAEIGYDKPDAEIFDYADALAKPETAVMIGDNWEDDVVEQQSCQVL